MMRSTALAILLLGASTIGASGLDRFPAFSGEDGEQLGCEEETVYGTFIVIDEELGVFGLLGTRYRFLSDQGFDLSALQGRTVRIQIGRDCGIEDIRVLDGRDETITQVDETPRQPAV